jgi:hypothetical protein
MLALLGLLVWLHNYLDNLLDVDAKELLDPKHFRVGHRWYLWLSTVQWALSLAYAMLSLQAWRSEDRAAGVETLRRSQATC